MRVNPYIEPLLLNVIDLLNAPPLDATDAQNRWRAAGMPPLREATQADSLLLRRYLDEWLAVVDATSERSRVAALNRLLQTYAVAPSITDHDGSGWHLHYRDPRIGFAGTLAGATAAAAAQFLTDRGMQRIGRCRLPECGRAFLDTSPPGRRRYCSHPCSNRDAVRRHRSRHRAG